MYILHTKSLEISQNTWFSRLGMGHLVYDVKIILIVQSVYSKNSS